MDWCLSDRDPRHERVKAICGTIFKKLNMDFE